jgi:hypothetical protein
MSELLKPTEQKIAAQVQPINFLGPLNEGQIGSLISIRKQNLESIKSQISRKRYFMIEEKIAAEENSLKQILNWQQGKNNQLSQYSFVLDTHYFEQEFLN